MHYATGNVKGLGYVISFSIGAITVTILMWLLRYTYHLIKLKSTWEAYEALPSFHLRVMWAPGAAAGMLWSMGNVGSILAVENLGQGVGYSASQAALLVSGMWGIFFFKVWCFFLNITQFHE
jgi:glucose uptake protein GlcU